MDSFVAPAEYDGKDPKGDSYYFVAFREGMVTKESNDDAFTDQERLIKYVYTVRVPAYLILDPDDETLSYGRDEKGKKFVYKTQSTNQIVLKESIMYSEEFEEKFGK